MSRPRVLVAGCTGLLGANLCLTARGSCEVLAASRGPFRMEGVAHIASPGDQGGWAGLIEDERPDLVVNCIAMTDVDGCERDPDRAYAVNASLAGILASAAAVSGAGFVQVSSDAVFDGEKGGPYRESDPVSAVNVYGKSKADGERLVLEADPDALVVRTNMYGFNYRRKSSLSEWVVGELEKGRRISMFEDVLFNPLLVNTLCSALLDLAAAGASGIVNVAATGGESKFQFGVQLKKELGLGGEIAPTSVDAIGLAAPRSHNMLLDNRLVSSEWGLSLPTIAEDLGRLRTLYQENYQEALRGE